MQLGIPEVWVLFFIENLTLIVCELTKLTLRMEPEYLARVTGTIVEDCALKLLDVTPEMTATIKTTSPINPKSIFRSVFFHFASAMVSVLILLQLILITLSMDLLLRNRNARTDNQLAIR